MPAYVVLAALAITFSIPLFAYTIGHDRGSDRRVTANLNAGLAEGGDLRRLILSEAFPLVRGNSQPPELATLCPAAAQGNHRLRQKISGQTPPGSAPLLAGALAIALGLIRIDLAHFF